MSGRKKQTNINVIIIAVAGPQWGTSGASGLLAVGFWDYTWNYDNICGYISSI